MARGDGATSTRLITRVDCIRLAASWRLRAVQLGQLAEGAASEGDGALAIELTEAAAEYRTAADHLEYGKTDSGV